MGLRFLALSVQSRAKAKGVESLVNKLSMLMPVAINKIAGKPIFPVQDQSVMMMLRGWVSSIISSPEKMQAMQKEYENKILELRLTELERKVKDLESAHEESSQGIKMQDVMAGVGSYFATQMSSKMNESTPKNETK